MIISQGNCQYMPTRRYGALRAPPSSSCGGLVAFGHIGGISGPHPVVPCWCWGGEISKMVSHMGSRAIFQCFVTFVTCDVWCVMWHMTCHVTCITIPCWCWGGDISEMVSHMGSKIVFSGLWHVWCVMCDVWCVMWHVKWHTSVPVTHSTPDILWKFQPNR